MAFISIRIRKAIGIAILTTFMLIWMSGCDVYCGKRPTDYPNTTWICKDPDIMFTVGEAHSGDLYCEVSGKPLEKDVILAFGFGAEFWIHNNSTGTNLFVGDSIYSSKTMYLDVTEDHLFNGAYTGKRIIFERDDQDQSD